MSQNESNLTPSQQRLLEHLLQGKTVSEAAQLAKIGRSTATRWLADERFKESYAKAQNEAFAEALSSLHCVSSQAVTALREILTDKVAPPAARISAARTVLEYALKAKDQFELEERLEQLEQLFQAQTKKGVAAR